MTEVTSANLLVSCVAATPLGRPNFLSAKCGRFGRFVAEVPFPAVLSGAGSISPLNWRLSVGHVSRTELRTSRMTTVVDQQQCQWCGTMSPSDADRCGLCRLPFNRAIVPPSNWNPPVRAAEAAVATPVAEAIPAVQLPAPAASGSAFEVPLAATTDAPVQQPSLAEAAHDLPSWLAALRSTPVLDVSTPEVAHDPLQVPLRGTPGYVSSGHRRQRQRRARRRARLLGVLVLLILAMGVFVALKLGLPSRLN